MSLRRLNAGDIVEATIAFEDGTGRKRRPGVVIEVRGGEVTLLFCTSQTKHGIRPGFVPLKDLDKAGLGRHTLVRILRPVVINAADLIGVLGRCSERDWKALSAAPGRTVSTA